jgi:hypothetical protein
MLTSYLVSCPHLGCGWFGSLLPSHSPGSPPVVTGSVVTFHCPQCETEWRAQVIGDDVHSLPLEDAKPVLSV